MYTLHTGNEQNSTQRVPFPDLKDGRYHESLGFKKVCYEIINRL